MGKISPGKVFPGTVPPAGNSGAVYSGTFQPQVSVPPGLGICAAALALAGGLPWFALRGPVSTPEGDRIKGGAGYQAELSAYLKGPGPGEPGSSPGAELKLADQASLRAGNTIQLAYRAPGDSSGDRYGVIFSIDGRSAVTLHYPYGPAKSTQLVSGRPVPLGEAYTLDDAPNYEIFFFVVGDEPLDPRNILNTAEQLAPRIAGNPGGALTQGPSLFKGYEVKILTLRKE